MNVVLEFIVFHLLFYYYILEAIVLFFIPARFRQKNIKGQTALITGAGSGIGRLMAHQFAKLGCKLVLWDVNSESNEQTAAEVREFNAEAYAYTCDVSNSDAVHRVANAVKDEVGDVDILVNNAGIISGRKILQLPDEMIKKTMNINALAHFWTVKAFLPAMLAKNRGHIVTIASFAGVIGANGLTDYCASKFAAVGLHESLRSELRGQKKTGVHTTVVCPTLIDTGMFGGCQNRFPSLLPVVKPEEAASEVVSAVLTNQDTLLLPKVLNFLFAIKNLLPYKSQMVLHDFAGSTNFMDTFRGRAKHE